MQNRNLCDIFIQFLQSLRCNFRSTLFISILSFYSGIRGSKKENRDNANDCNSCHNLFLTDVNKNINQNIQSYSSNEAHNYQNNPNNNSRDKKVSPNDDLQKVDSLNIQKILKKIARNIITILMN